MRSTVSAELHLALRSGAALRCAHYYRREAIFNSTQQSALINNAVKTLRLAVQTIIAFT
jgi:hypothetical protein